MHSMRSSVSQIRAAVIRVVKLLLPQNLPWIFTSAPAWINACANIVALPWPKARIRLVLPSLFTRFTSAPARTNVSMHLTLSVTLICQLQIVYINVVLLQLSFSSTFAPTFSRSLMHMMLLSKAAFIKATLPHISCVFTSTPACIRLSTHL